MAVVINGIYMETPCAKSWDIHSAKMKTLNELLKHHNFYFRFETKDDDEYAKGEKDHAKIMQLIEDIGSDAQKLYDAYMCIHFGPHEGFCYPT